MMGVLGAEFGAEIEPSKLKTTEEQSKKKIVEGFGLTKYSHAMHTSMYPFSLFSSTFILQFFFN